MGPLRFAARPKLVKMRTRRQRRLMEGLKKLGIWIFLLLFVVSIGGAIVVVALVSH
jgi:hypothetical protein